MRLMDDELKNYRSKRRLPEEPNDDHETDQSSDDDDDQMLFRDVNPMEMNETQLSEVLGDNIRKSRQQEGFLDPGPASIMLK